MLQGHSTLPQPPPAEQGLRADISAPNMCALLLFPTLPGPSGLSECPLESHGYTCLAADLLAVPRASEVRLLILETEANLSEQPHTPLHCSPGMAGSAGAGTVCMYSRALKPAARSEAWLAVYLWAHLLSELALDS